MRVTEEDLDSEALVFRHIDRIMRTASMDLESLSGDSKGREMDADTWGHRVMFSAEFFHAFLKPAMEEQEHQELEKKAKESVEDFKNPFDKIRYAKDLFQSDIERLHQNNMIFQESDDLVIEDESEEKLEPESSDVEEEVIE